MKLHSIILGSVLMLAAGCKENHTFRNQFKAPGATSPITSVDNLTQIYSLKKIGYRCDLITESEVKEIFLRIHQDQATMKLSFHDFREDGSLSLGMVSIGHYKVMSIEMEKASATKGSLKWVGESAVIVDQKINESGESIRSANVKVTLHADPLDEVSESERTIVDMKISGKFEVSELVKTAPVNYERRDFRDLATFENCDEMEALQIGVR